MSNTYFRFKQFQVRQERCAMKVSTDACIQGAWVPVPNRTKRLLDIGCGTGLLSLMVAQRHPDVWIDAVEVEVEVAQQAIENVAASPWGNRIQVVHGDARNYTALASYDMIICNPPFFSNDLQGQDRNRNRARHDVSLTQIDLLSAIVRNLKEDGAACVLLPPREHALWEQLLTNNGWYIKQTLSVRPSDHKQVNRVVSVAVASPPEGRSDEELTIYDSPGIYTDRFTALLQPYYLYL